MLNSKDVLTLPDGIIRNAELKKIPNIFSEENLLVAAEIIVAVNDCDLIFSKADVLERAYFYGWLKIDIEPLEQKTQRLIKETKIDKISNKPSNRNVIIVSFIALLYLLVIPLFGAYVVVYCNKSQESKELTQEEKSEDAFIWTLGLFMLFVCPMAGYLSTSEGSEGS